MLKLIAKLFFKISGWTVDLQLPPYANRCVMIAAPHTSNWDIIITRFAFVILDIPLKFTIKDDWMKFPTGSFFRALGAIGIDRSPKKPGSDRPSMVEAMAALFSKHKDLVMMVTPEGTRKRVTKWKTGFYHTANIAKVPICFGYLDYGKKIAGVGGYVIPTGSYEKDMELITAFYADKHPKFPEKFSLDEETVKRMQRG